MNCIEYPSYDDFDLDDEEQLKNKNQVMPPKLFKYTNVHRAKDLLYDNIMYLPEISELNDPYEGELLYDERLFENAYFKYKRDEFNKKQKISSRTLQKLLKNNSSAYVNELKQYLHKGIYFICLSSSNKINSLWAHYADNHKGMCIEYDMNDCVDKKFLKDSCFKIEYVKKSDYTQDLKKQIKYDESSRNWMLKPFLRKSQEWNYEKEWRIILTEKGILHNRGFYPYKPYIEFFKPSSVYMGLNVSNKNENLIKEICEIKKIPLYKAKKNNRNFDFDFENVI